MYQKTTFFRINNQPPCARDREIIPSFFMITNLSYRIRLKLKWCKSRKEHIQKNQQVDVERFCWNRNLIMRKNKEIVNSWVRSFNSLSSVRARLAEKWVKWLMKEKKAKNSLACRQCRLFDWEGRLSRSNSPNFVINHFLYAKLFTHEGKSRSPIIIWCCNILDVYFFYWNWYPLYKSAAQRKC